MFPKYLLFAVSLVAIAGVAAAAAMETAVLSQIQQDADAKGCAGGGTGFNASKGRCFKPDLQASESDDSDDEEEEEEEEEDE